MIKILFIGPYRQQDGWGNAAKARILSMQTCPDIDLYIRPIYMARNIREENDCEIFKELEQKRSNSYDLVVEHCIPQYAVKNNDKVKKTCLMFETETKNLVYTLWPYYTSVLSDFCIMPAYTCAEDVRTPDRQPYIVEHAVDTSIFTDVRTGGKITELNDRHNGEFLFYFIGEYTTRKNIFSLVAAFYKAFAVDEPVQLVLKVNSSSVRDPVVLQQKILNEIVYPIQKTMRFSKFKIPIIITRKLSEEEMNELHKRCNCFVMPSCGESCCLPMLKALGFGKTPLVTANTGMVTYLRELETDLSVMGVESPVMNNTQPLPFLYSAHENWINISINHLAEKMIQIYTNKEYREKLSKKCKETVENYSYDKIGEKLYGVFKKELLNV